MNLFKALAVTVSLLILVACFTGCDLLNTTKTTATTPTTAVSPTPSPTPTPTTSIGRLEILGWSNVYQGVVGQSFVRQLPAAGGVPPYNWTIASGSLPPGLSLNSNGQITGTPTSAGAFPYRIRLTDSKGTSAELDYTQNIAGSGTSQFILLWAQTLSYNENQTIAYVPFVQGSALPWTFTIEGLPEGITYDPATGLIRGTVSSADVLLLTISLKDADGHEAINSPVTASFMVNPPKPVNIKSTSPYEGTYIGIFSYQYETYATETTPAKTVSGGFRLTITLSDPITANGLTVLQITHASCSDPYFGAQMGCTPNFGSVATLPADPPTSPSNPSQAGMGIAILFPNGATLGTTNSPGAPSVSYGGRTISNSLDTAIQNNTWVAASLSGNAFMPEASALKFKSWSLSWSAA
jgi:hypothetical protein